MSYSIGSTVTGVTSSTYGTGPTFTSTTVNTEALRNLESGKSCCCDCLWACMLNDDDYDSDKDTVGRRKPQKKESSWKPISHPLRDTRGSKVTKIEEDEPWSFMDSPTSDDDGKSIIRRLQSQQEKEEYLEYRQWKKQKEMKLMKSNSRASLSKNRRTSSVSRSKSRPRYDDDSTIETRESDRTECSESLESKHPRHDSGKSERSTRSKRKSWLGRKAKSDRNQETWGPSRSRSRSRSAHQEFEGHEHHRSRSRGKKERSELPPRSAKDSVKKSKKAKRTGILLKKSKGYKDGHTDEAHPSVESSVIVGQSRTRTSTEDGIQARQEKKPKGKGILVNGAKSREPESNHKKSSKPLSGSNKTNDQLSHSDPSRERKSSHKKSSEPGSGSNKTNDELSYSNVSREPESSRKKSSKPVSGSNKTNDQILNSNPSCEPESSCKKSSERVSGSNKKNHQLSASNPSQKTSRSDEAKITHTHDRDADNSVPPGTIGHEKQDNMDDKGAMHDRAVDTTSSGELDDKNTSVAKTIQMYTDNEKSSEGPKTNGHEPEEDNKSTSETNTTEIGTDSEKSNNGTKIHSQELAATTSTRDEINSPRLEKSDVPDDDREEAEHTSTSSLDSAMKPLQQSEDYASGQPNAQSPRSRASYFQEKVGGIGHSLPADSQSIKSSPSFSKKFSMGAIFHSLSAEQRSVTTKKTSIDKEFASSYRIPPSNVLSIPKKTMTASLFGRRKSRPLKKGRAMEDSHSVSVISALTVPSTGTSHKTATDISISDSTTRSSSLKLLDENTVDTSLGGSTGGSSRRQISSHQRTSEKLIEKDMQDVLSMSQAYLSQSSLAASHRSGRGSRRGKKAAPSIGPDSVVSFSFDEYDLRLVTAPSSFSEKMSLPSRRKHSLLGKLPEADGNE